MLGKKIKTARKAAGLTQGQLAVKVQTTKSVISEYENGNRNPSFEVLSKLATALNCNLRIELDPKE